MEIFVGASLHSTLINIMTRAACRVRAGSQLCKYAGGVRNFALHYECDTIEECLLHEGSMK